MTAITSKMDLINDISRDILAYLERDDCDLVEVLSLLHKRKEIIKMIDDLLADYDLESITKEDEKMLIERFLHFRSLHKKTEPLLEKQLDSQKEQIGDTLQLRKAEEKYHLSGEPDISYFSQR